MVDYTTQLTSFPVNSCSIRVLLVHAVSPSSFYIRFPNGMRDADHLSSAEQLRTCSPRHEKFKASLAKFYEENPKRFLLSSLPAPGSLFIVKNENVWERAIALDEEDSGEDISRGDEDLRVFLIDEGKPTTTCLNDMRYTTLYSNSSSRNNILDILRSLHSEFQSFAHQAVHCQLDNVEPLGESWTVEAKAFFASFVESKELRAKRSTPPKGLPQSDVCVEVHLQSKEIEP